MSDKTWEQVGSAAGICFAILFVAGFLIVPSPPHINAFPANIANYYFRNRGSLLTSGVLQTLGSVFFLWFVSQLRDVLQRAESGRQGLSTLVFISGTAVAVVGLVAVIPQATLAFGSHRLELIFNPGVVTSLFYMSNIITGVLAIAVGLFLASASLAMVRKELVAPPLGYAGLLFSAAAFAGGISVFYVTTYNAAWLGLQIGALLAALAWVAVASVAMIVRPEMARPETPGPAYAHPG